MKMDVTKEWCLIMAQIEGDSEIGVGPYGCLCKSFNHHMVGDGCEICNPDMAKRYEEEVLD